MIRAHLATFPTRAPIVMQTVTSNLPRLAQIEDAAGYVDLRHARLHHQADRWMWIVPRQEGWLTSTMTDDLQASSLFQTVNRNPAAGDDERAARPAARAACWIGPESQAAGGGGRDLTDRPLRFDG
ncbi:MAG: hypothetical protein FJX25_17320 [Alphaproteobacteria bacterium]|nr:hypothetical protein [Alphaproteobacteria bacterium]